MSDALIVFAKVPQPGAVKTRLTPVLDPDEAARLYEAFLRDALHQYRNLDADVRLYLAGPVKELADGIVPADVGIFEQNGDDLGARMQNALRESFDAGGERLCIVGTDHPTLPTGFIRQAFRSLASAASICIGPSADGGFYLLGMNDRYDVLFDDMTYSHSRVFTDTLARVSRTDARLTVLPRWYDVDTPETLRRMLDDLSDHSDTTSHTRAVVEDLELRKICT